MPWNWSSQQAGSLNIQPSLSLPAQITLAWRPQHSLLGRTGISWMNGRKPTARGRKWWRRTGQKMKQAPLKPLKEWWVHLLDVDKSAWLRVGHSHSVSSAGGAHWRFSEQHTLAVMQGTDCWDRVNFQVAGLPGPALPPCIQARTCSSPVVVKLECSEPCETREVFYGPSSCSNSISFLFVKFWFCSDFSQC